MRDGFVKVAAASPKLRVADCPYNREEIVKCVREMEKKKAKIMVFPELAITGYTCGDLFWQDTLLSSAKEELLILAQETRDVDALIFVGLPWEDKGKLYNVAAALCRGEILGLVPKKYLPNYGEFYEARHFTEGEDRIREISLLGKKINFGSKQLFVCQSLPKLVVGVEICEDLWAPLSPSRYHCLNGASLMVNLSAGDEVTGKSDYRRKLLAMQSASLICAYLYASASDGESTTDMVFAGHNIIAENGSILAETDRFKNQMIYSEVDIFKLDAERRKNTTYRMLADEDYVFTDFTINTESTELTRYFPKKPFVPDAREDKKRRCEEILMIQAMGLKKRMEHTNCKSAIIGISGGLDSTLALLVTAKAFDLLGLDRKNICAVTMPCFGTSDRTYKNACNLTLRLGANLREVDIKESVLMHFRDIGQDVNQHDVTYENAQARERTQVLMDISNRLGGLVVGTGDLSELALGWATYNGDHMSMYAVNASVPKTLIRHLVSFYAHTCKEEGLSEVLADILDTPVSPELLPPKDGEIAQKTEDLVGPYELHDFFLYYMQRFGFSPKKIYRLACYAFADSYEKEIILKWLKIFYHRYFSQQFKRSCLPDGPKVGSVAVSPRGDLRMPSDACVRIWKEEAERIKE